MEEKKVWDKTNQWGERSDCLIYVSNTIYQQLANTCIDLEYGSED